jgi:sec-independent protein translocase protein TatA
MFGDLQPWHVIVILAVLVLLFGSRKLPGAAKSVGQSLRIFKSEMRQASKDNEPEVSASFAAPESYAQPAPPQAVEAGQPVQTTATTASAPAEQKH